MPASRREFIHYVGLLLASAIVRSCGPTCYTPGPLTPYPEPTSPADARWAALQACWLDLRDSRLQSFEDNDFIRTLRQRHQEALAALVAAGEVASAVAEEMAVAFEQAIAHIQRGMATCYIALPPEYLPRQDLLQQATLLEEMAAKSDIVPATVAQARAALERDIEWLTQFQAGRVPGALQEIAADPDAVEAARVLVGLLLGR